MLTIPDEVKTLFQTDGVHKNFHVHFPNGDTTDLNNENIVQEAVQFTESLCSQQYFKFGLAEASQIEFTAVGIPNILGATIECAIEIDCTSLGAAWASSHPVDPTLDYLEPQTCMVDSKLYYRIPYGRFIVDSCPRDHSVMAQRKIVAYTEQFLKDTGSLQGQYPTSKLKIDPLKLALAINTSTEDMAKAWDKDPTTWDSSTFSWSFTGHYTSDGTHQLKNISAISSGIAQADCGQSIYSFRVEYEPHELDAYGKHFFDTALASIPSGDFIYYADKSVSPTSYKKWFSSNGNMMISASGGFEPCLIIRVAYLRQTLGQSFWYYKDTKPIFVKPNETYILDLTDLNNLPYIDPNRNAPSGYNFERIQVRFILPLRWKKLSHWEYDSGDSETITDWATGVPFGTGDFEKRSGDYNLYYKNLSIVPGYTSLPMTINSTLTINKGPTFGKYYTYANAFSVLKSVQGALELSGEFMQSRRIGSYDIIQLSENQATIPVTESQREEFWWDENEVEPIGQVNVKFADSDSGEESVSQFPIGSGQSIYTMEDNELLTNTQATTAEIQTALETYFEPNASVINFTPVDLKMKGLPYLEAGDKIELTADDGEIVESYILEQTISGIQHLQADIISTNGELLEVIPE